MTGLNKKLEGFENLYVKDEENSMNDDDAVKAASRAVRADNSKGATTYPDVLADPFCLEHRCPFSHCKAMGREKCSPSTQTFCVEDRSTGNERRSGSDRRDIAMEHTRVATGSSGAQSSKQIEFFHLISPYTIRRLAQRKFVGGVKYGWVQWRRGINDIEYVADRLNHLFDHLMGFMEDGNEKDDNLGAMLWALDALIEIERLAPEVLHQVIGTCKLFGDTAKTYHDAETPRREAWQKRKKAETWKKNGLCEGCGADRTGPTAEAHDKDCPNK